MFIKIHVNHNSKKSAYFWHIYSLLFYGLTPTISVPRRTAKPENTKPFRGAGALDRVVRHRFVGYSAWADDKAVCPPYLANHGFRRK